MHIPIAVQLSLVFVFKEQYFDMARKYRMVTVLLGVAWSLPPAVPFSRYGAAFGFILLPQPNSS